MGNKYTLNNGEHFHKVAVATVDFPAGGTTVTSGIMIPYGAIVTGLKIMAQNLLTVAAVSGTLEPRIGTVPIAATSVISDYPARYAVPIVSTDGLYGAWSGGTEGEFNVVFGASSNSTANAQYYYYIDYLYIYD